MTSPLREMTAAARRMARGDYAGRVTATSRDEVGELARAFNPMAADLAAVDRQRRELVANVSHELRTPLTALCAVLENLVDGVAEPDPVALRAGARPGRAARRAGRRPARPVPGRRRRGAARPRAGRRARRCSSDAVAEARVLGRDGDLRRRASTRRTSPSRADPARLHQLVANLLDNAARHSPAGGVGPGARRPRRRRLAARGRRRRARASPPADRDRVFERFGTADRTDGGGGTGLGLAIARWVTDLHGGAIRVVDPEPARAGARGCASTCRASLPDRPPAPDSPEEAACRTARPARMPRDARRRAGRRRRPPQRSGAARRTPPPEPRHGRAVRHASGPSAASRPSARCCSACGVGLLAGDRAALPRPRARHGRWCCSPRAAVRARRQPAPALRRSRWPAPGCASLLASRRDAARRRLDRRAVPARRRPCSARSAWPRAARVPAFVASLAIAWPLAGIARPAVAGSLRAGDHRADGSGAAVAPHGGLVGARRRGLRAALRLRRRDVRASGSTPSCPTSTLDTFVLRAFLTVAVGGVVLAAAYLALNPPQRRAGRRGTPARSRTASSGWCRCCWSTPSSWCSWRRRPR